MRDQEAFPDDFRNSLVMFVLTFWSYGGLYQIIFRLRGFFLTLGVSGWYRNFYLCLLSSSAFWYKDAAFLNTSSFDEISNSRLFTPSGMFFMTAVYVDKVFFLTLILFLA